MVLKRILLIPCIAAMGMPAAAAAVSKPNILIQTEADSDEYDDEAPTLTFYGSSMAEKLADNADSDVFTKNWETDHVFAYRNVSLKDIPAVTEIELIGSLEDFCAPVVGRISSKYGPRGRRDHKGIDIPLTKGDPVCAAFGGKIRYARFNSGGFGNLVIIRHPNGLETWYGHLSRINVDVDDFVEAGDIIGLGGNTGRSKGAHLHFEVRYQDQNFDPERIIDFTTGDLKYQTFVLDKSYLNVYSRATDKLDEDYETTIFASDDGEITSDEILRNIAEHANKQPAPGTVISEYHRIKNGDTLSKIARQYGTSVRRLCQLNSIKETTVIRAGQRLRVK